MYLYNKASTKEKNNKQFAAGFAFVYFIKQQSKVQKAKENQRTGQTTEAEKKKENNNNLERKMEKRRLGHIAKQHLCSHFHNRFHASRKRIQNVKV